MHGAIEVRFQSQVEKAIEIIKGAQRPVKFSYIEVQLNAPVFRRLEDHLRSLPNIAMNRYHNEIYYTWEPK